MVVDPATVTPMAQLVVTGKVQMNFSVLEAMGNVRV